MAQSPVRRPPARRPSETARAPSTALVAPAQQLPARPSTAGRDATVCTAGGLTALGGAALLGHPDLGAVGLALGVAAAAGRGVHGIRARARRELADRLTEALAPGLGLRGPDRRTVRLRSWTHGWPGVPKRVALRYAPGVDDTDPVWLEALVATVCRRLLADYEVAGHDRRRCRIRLAWAPPRAGAAALPAVQARAQRTVVELLGPTARVFDVQWDAGELVGIDVTHEAGAKLASAQYRHRIERVVSTMLPGRWRAHWELEGDKVRFEVRPELPKRVDHPSPVLSSRARYQIPLAVGEDGDVIVWNLRGTGPHAMVVGKTGTGKSQALDTPVPTPSGWTTMGELRDGDVVFDEAGAPCTVLKAHPVQYGRPCYQVVFSDGCTVVADAEHLWWTQTRPDRVSRSNRRASDGRRGGPLGVRMAEDVLGRLRAEAASAGPSDVLSLPELARLVGMDPSHLVLREIAARVGPSGTRARPEGLFSYRQQTVRQRQSVALFDRGDVLRYLALRARAPRWRYPVNPGRLQQLAAEAAAGQQTTLSEIGELLAVGVDTAREVVRGSDVRSSRGDRIVELNVPARVIARRLPGGHVTLYPARALLEQLVEWGAGATKTRHRPRPPGAVRTTEEIAATLRCATGQANHSVPVAGVVQYPAAEQPIPAYVLGAWEGDGTSSAPEITSADPEIAALIEAEGVTVVDRGRPASKPLTYQARTYALRGIRRALDQLKLLRGADLVRRIRSKHLPVQYLIASEQQRRALLAGLLDTDGTVAAGGAVEFDNTNPVLARQVHELVCSLGYRATLREGRAVLDGRDCGPTWTVSFSTTDVVFRLARKRATHRARSTRANAERTRSRYIVDVRPVASVPVRCISVDSPNRLYLVGKSFIPTHNTVVINGVVMEVAARQWRVWICDPKQVEFMGLRGYPNVQVVASTVEDMVAVILRAWEEMEHRYDQVAGGRADEGDFEPLVVVLDEYRDFVAMVTAWWASIKARGMPSRCPVFERVGSLARKGRTAQVHLVLGTQRPDADFLSGEMRDNFGTRISLGRLSPQGAMMMWEASYIGVSVPKGIPGRGTAVTDDDRPVEVQGYWTPDPRRAAKIGSPADLAILRRLRPAHSTHPPLEVRLHEGCLDLDTGEDARPWDAVRFAQLVPAQLRVDPQPDAQDHEADPAVCDTVELAVVDDPAADTDVDDGADTDDLDEDYGPEEDLRARDLAPGDLVLVDEATHLWAVVEAVEDDLDEDDVVLVDWRGDGDEAGTLAVPDGQVVTARPALAEPTDADREE